MTDLSGYALSPLRNGESTLYRASGEGLAPILLVFPASDSASGSSKRLEHEYALRAELDPAWAARPLDLIDHHGRTILVLEDPGGDPLERRLGAPLGTAEFLRIAIPLADALHRTHQRGLVHKDIKPANVLVDRSSGDVWLTGFGIASRNQRERQSTHSSDEVSGTLAYLAPEQSGRMNRSVDSRSDLYALGVVFYEMLTGALPFHASDPMEWIHCHIARRAVPPEERVASVPAQLSAIAMRLLAKTPEERYQTAAGVEADLRRCLAEWESLGHIDPFPPGVRDVADRLLIPEKLYGREREIEALLAAFERVATDGAAELVLVSGYSGIGKSSVVNELHKVLVPAHGLFAAGKFEQYKRDIPYATLAQAFQSLVRQLLRKGDAELARWRGALVGALGPNGQLMVNLIPELALIIGEQPPVSELAPQEAQIRFQSVFRRFIGVFARSEHPLALFLDDLQWLDPATLALLEHLATEPDTRHLLLIGAYRDNEVSHSHPLMRTLESIGRAGGRISQIVLGPLMPEDVAQLVADSLHAHMGRVRPLAELVFDKTAGNPFFVIQFVSALGDDGLLSFDHERSAWQWEVDRIRAKGITDNVADLMAAKLGRLPEATREVLGQLACLGNVAEIGTVAAAYGGSEDQLHTVLRDAVQAGLVFRIDGAYTFLHDRVQEAAYALIPEAERAAAHLRIGRMLVSRTPAAEIEERIFEIVNQLNRGAALVESPAERRRTAELNLIAGKRAKTSTAYASALTLFMAGRALLEADGPLQRDRLSFELEFQCAQCEFLTGEIPAAEDRLLALQERAADLAELAEVVCLAVLLYFTTGRSDRASEIALQFLERVGIAWSAHPTDDEVRREYERMRQKLAGRPIESLIDLPAMTDAGCLATLDVLTELFPASFYVDRNLVELVLLRMTNLSLEHGHGDGSSVAYAALNMVLGPRFGDYQTAYGFGQLACELVDRRGLDRFKGRVYSCVGSFAMPWTRHLPSCRPLLKLAFEAQTSVGDLAFAAYTFRHLVTNLLISGAPLAEVQEQAEQALVITRKAGLGMPAEQFIGQLDLIRALRGFEPDADRTTDAMPGDAWSEQHLETQPHLAMAACFHWIFALEAHFFAEDYAAGIEAAAQAARLLWSTRSCFEEADYHFYSALTRAAACDGAPAARRTLHMKVLLGHLEQISTWAEICPENFSNRAALLHAEVARLEGRDMEAMRIYDDAIRLARANHFVQNEGLANELAARFYAARGFETIAVAYLRNARSCYVRWGAAGKVRRLEDRFPSLRKEPMELAPTATFGAPGEHLDVATVVKASQALSSEIVLGKLIEKLMRIAVEHAGADRGLLILLRGDEMEIEAEAITGRGGTEVAVRRSAVAPSDLPRSLLHFVMRTREPVVLDDASTREADSDDLYLRVNRPRSVLCLPIVQQTKSVGALYLENSLAPGVFTSARVAVLELLASQAAISLENARLYDELRRNEAFLAEGQTISSTGSFGWNVESGEIHWSDETYRIFGYDPALRPTLEWLLAERVHPDDRVFVQETLAHGVQQGTNFDFEHRLQLPDGTVKHLHLLVHRLQSDSPVLEFVGTIADVTARKAAEQALRAQSEALHRAQSELAHITRVVTLGELTASIAHEVSQPLAAIVTNGLAALRWLGRDVPDVDEASRAAERVVRDGQRAGKVIHRLRALSEKAEPQRTLLPLGEVLGEAIQLVQHELLESRISLQLELEPALPMVRGDRVQLQQVIINLMLNGIQAMAPLADAPRELRIEATKSSAGEVLVAVRDTGIGIGTEDASRLFEPFFTTKANGMGMGLSICRSIVEDHGGRLWASSSEGGGAAFRFTLPIGSDTNTPTE